MLTQGLVRVPIETVVALDLVCVEVTLTNARPQASCWWELQHPSPCGVSSNGRGSHGGREWTNQKINRWSYSEYCSISDLNIVLQSPHMQGAGPGSWDTGSGVWLVLCYLRPFQASWGTSS